MKHAFTRRQFVQSTAALSIGAMLSNSKVLAAGQLASEKQHFHHASYSSVKERKIGSLTVSAIGLGCMNMAGIYNPPQNKADMVAVIRQALENGVNFLDTAEVYGPFFSEEIVGEAIAPYRDKVNVATKFGFSYNGNNVTGRNSSPAHIRKAVEGMLQRLKIETIDLLYLHRMDPSVPVEDIAGTVAELIKEGKARNFGLSEVSPDTIRKAHAVHPVAALQSEYSMLERVMENDMLPLCEELGIAFVPWGPVCRGMLTGRFDENFVPEKGFRRAGVPYFEPEALDANLKVTALAKQWGERKSASPAQVALAWLVAQKPFIVPIPGTTNSNHLIENIGARDIAFTASELNEFRTALAAIPRIGFRAPDSVFRNL